MWRIGSGVTRWLGSQYRPNHQRIEIDITYACNLGCHSCNRSVSQAPADQMTLEQIRHFIHQSIQQKRKWERIRLLRGEPTVHTQILEILRELLEYKRHHSPRTIVEIATNGYGKKVNDMLARMPEGVVIVNTFKTSVVQEHFVTFNVAPADLDEYEGVDYTNGCEVPEVAGIGLTKYGFYPCAVAGGIDRIYGLNLGRQSIPDKGDQMKDELRQLCRFCGHFKRGDHVIGDPQQMSATWRKGYADYQRKKPVLPVFESVTNEERVAEPLNEGPG